MNTKPWSAAVLVLSALVAIVIAVSAARGDTFMVWLCGPGALAGGLWGANMRGWRRESLVLVVVALILMASMVHLAATRGSLA